MTREKVGAKGEGMMFSDTQEVHRAYEGRQIDLQAKVKVRVREWSKSPEGVFTMIVAAIQQEAKGSAPWCKRRHNTAGRSGYRITQCVTASYKQPRGLLSAQRRQYRGGAVGEGELKRLRQGSRPEAA
jgi:hypothetical protein